MKRSLLVVLLAGMTLLVPQAALGIVYGVPDGGAHPNVGSFVGTYTDPDTGETELFQLCTGTLVDDDVVLSASHCFSDLGDAITDITFTLDEVIDADQDGVVDPGVSLLSGEPVTHPSYGVSGGGNNPYDIAVFLLDDPVTSVTPAELPAVGTLDDKSLRQRTFTAVGYGTVRETRRKATQSLQLGWRRERADQHLKSTNSIWVTFSMNQATGDGGTCYGDSGGPHFLGDVVVATTITGDTMCKSIDQDYRIDTPWALAFLHEYVSGS